MNSYDPKTFAESSPFTLEHSSNGLTAAESLSSKPKVDNTVIQKKINGVRISTDWISLISYRMVKKPPVTIPKISSCVRINSAITAMDVNPTRNVVQMCVLSESTLPYVVIISKNQMVDASQFKQNHNHFSLLDCISG